MRSMYRSPVAHARLVKLDLSAVQAHPSVVLTIDGNELPEYVRRMEPFPFQSRNPFRGGNPDIKFHDRYGMATDKVRYVGEPVAVIVATSKYAAEDALEMVEAEYEPLPVVLDAEKATADDAPLLYEDWGDNIALKFKVSSGDIDQAFEDADVVIRERLTHHRFSGTPIEPRGVVASYDKGDNVVTVWSSTQIPHIVAALLEDSIKEPEHMRARVIAPNIGGGFGQKWGFYSEELVVPLASVLTGKPVRWIETRHEHMIATNHAREQIHHLEMALKSDGTVLGVRDKIYADLGDAYPVGGFAAIITTTMYVPGAYQIQNYACELNGVVTNKTPFGAHRGFGKSEAAFVIERMMNIAAPTS
jgi:aerobic carbon-monoxide dehydrogenase large subunit